MYRPGARSTVCSSTETLCPCPFTRQRTRPRRTSTGRIEFKNLESDAARQLHEGNAGTAAIAAIAAIAEALAGVSDDETFWRYQARSLAIFVTPERLFTFRLPNRLQNNAGGV